MAARMRMDDDEGDSRLIESMRHYYHMRANEYDDWYERRGAFDVPTIRDAWYDELEQVGRWIEQVSGRRVLEIACGTGHWTQRLLSTHKVVALDASPAMLDLARSRVGANASFCQADAYRLPFRSHSFDAAVFAFWISHIPPKRVPSFLQEVRRVVRPNGCILCVDGMRPSSAPWQPGTGSDAIVQTRTLRDGSRHRIVKTYYDAERLRRALKSMSVDLCVQTTPTFFIAARYRVD